MEGSEDKTSDDGLCEGTRRTSDIYVGSEKGSIRMPRFRFPRRSYYCLDPKATLRDERHYLGSGTFAAFNAQAASAVAVDEVGREMLSFLRIPRSWNECIREYIRLRECDDGRCRSAAREEFEKDLDDLLYSLSKEQILVAGDRALSITGEHQGWICLNPPVGARYNVASYPLQMDVHATKQCNLRCRHCCVNSDVNKPPAELTTEEVIGVLAEADRYGVHLFKFCGGEPFLREDFPDLLDAACQKRFCLSIQSNLTTVTKEDAERLGRMHSVRGKDGFGIDTSLDGATADVHDWFRGRPEAFRRVLHGLRLLSEHDISITIQTTLNERNYDQIDAIAELASRFGTSVLRYLIPISAGRAATLGDLSLTREQIMGAMRRVADLRERYSGRMNIDFDPRHTPIWDDGGPADTAMSAKQRDLRPSMSDWLKGGLPPCTCPGGMYRVAIDADGKVYPCTDSIGSQKLCAGSIRDASLLDVWQNETWNVLRGGWSWSDLKQCHACIEFDRCEAKICRGYPGAVDNLFGAMPECLDSEGNLIPAFSSQSGEAGTTYGRHPGLPVFGATQR